MTDEQKRSFIINVVFIALIMLVVYAVFKYLFIWAFPFVVGVLAALAFQRPIDYLTKRSKLPRTAWSLFLVAFTFAVLTFAVSVICIILFQELTRFAETLPGYVPALNEWFESIRDSFATSTNDNNNNYFGLGIKTGTSNSRKEGFNPKV